MSSVGLNINRFHILIFALWQCSIFFCCQQIFPIFYNLTPSRDCDDPNFHWSEEKCKLNTKEQCDELKNCSQIVVDKPVFHSMVEDFDLYCGKKGYDATLVSTIQFVGVLCGTVIYGHLGDYFGRRPISIIGITIGVAFGVASGFANSWQLFAAFRFIVGSSVACILVVFYTYMVEMILPQQRVFFRTFFNWGYARIVFTFTCFLCGYWRSAAMATALLSFPIVPVLLFVLPESPTWYTKKGRYEDALKAEKLIAKLSGTEVPSEVKIRPEVSEKVYTMKDLFTERSLAARTAVLCCLWFSTSLSAFGSDLNSGNLAGSFYVTQFVSGLVTALMKIFVFLLDTYWKGFDRRRLHQIPQVLMILCYVAIMILIIFVNEPNCSGDTARDWSIIIINIVGVSLIEITWDACYLVAVECFPTHLRTIGMGTCSLLARTGALLAPQMAYLSNLAEAAPYGVVVSIGIFSLAISLLFLPDTKNVNLATVDYSSSSNNNRVEEVRDGTISSSIKDQS